MKATVGSAIAAGVWLLATPMLPAQAPAPAKNAVYAKLAEPWPEPERLRERRINAEQRPLFQSDEPLAFTLTADFKAINKERTPNNTKRFPATLVVGDVATGTPVPVMLGSRGHFRLRNTSCSFVPLRVEFPATGVQQTVFEGPRTLKLVTHCRDAKAYEQYTLHEYLAYRILNLLTPRSFRARLVRTTYVDTAGAKAPITRYSMFLEDDDDVARRAEGRIVDVPNLLFRDLDTETLTLVSLFQYLIANTDYSIIRLHNVRLIQKPDRVLYPVPYDFDFSGLVNTTYSSPDKQLGIYDVRERLYRGPCRTAGELEPVLERFRAKKIEIMALYDTLPDLDAGYRRDARRYLEEFYAIAERPDRIKKVLVDGCPKTAGM